jgi:hypothetical protein
MAFFFFLLLEEVGKGDQVLPLENFSFVTYRIIVYDWIKMKRTYCNLSDRANIYQEILSALLSYV